MGEDLTAMIGKINFPSYIDEVQNEIGKTLEAIGKGETQKIRVKKD